MDDVIYKGNNRTNFIFYFIWFRSFKIDCTKTQFRESLSRDWFIQISPPKGKSSL